MAGKTLVRFGMDGQAMSAVASWAVASIYIHKMSADGTRLLDDGQKVYEGPVAEGTKLFKRMVTITSAFPKAASVPVGRR